MKKYIVISLFVTLIACSTNQVKNDFAQDISSVSMEFDQVLNDYFKKGLELDPISATRVGIEGYNHSFTNFLADEYIEKAKKYYNKYLERIAEFNADDLTREQIISMKVIEWECEQNIKRLEYRQDFLPIDQTWSVNHLIGQWAAGTGAQPFKTVKDYKNWLNRLDGYLDWMETAIMKMEEGIKLGYVLPKSLITKIPSTLEPFISENPDVNPFFGPLKLFPESFSEMEKNDLEQLYTEMITERIIPAYKSLHEFMSTTYFDAGRESTGIDGIPQGESYYKYLIEYQTSTNLTANEIFQIGLGEVARIQQEMEGVKTALGLEGSLQDFFKYIRGLDILKPYSEPSEAIEHFKEIHDKIKPQVDSLFDLKPNIGFEIRRTEQFHEKTTGPHYEPGSTDGTRPGIFYVSIPNVKEYNVMFDESVFLHEAIPGHHFQISLTQENESLPDFRKYLWVYAYGEGWALYTESLGKELGLFVDPYQYLGNLSEEMHRAVRLVVDVGIHAKGWTKEKAINYSLEHEPYNEEVITTEIERYMAFPGQALGYKIGQLKILELKLKAENELGESFNIKDFHNTILSTGCVPLTVLEEIVDDWIEKTKST